MSLFRPERIRTGIAGGRILCAAGDVSAPVRHEVAFDVTEDRHTDDPAQCFAAALVSALDAIMGGRRSRTSLCLAVSCDVSKHWIVEPPAGLSSLRELQAVAEARFVSLFALHPEEWNLTGDWHPDRPSLCAAVPRWLIEGLDTVCKQRGIDYDIATALGATLERHKPRIPDGWCCIQTPRFLSLMLVQDRLPVAMRLAPHEPGEGEEANQRAAALELRRELLRRGEVLDQSVMWLDLTLRQAVPTATTLSEIEGIQFRADRLAFGVECGALDLMIDAEARAGETSGLIAPRGAT